MINKNIGRKIKALRKLSGISQIKLAEKIGISFQQIQKYEKGSTRISVDRLLQIASALEVPVTTFFEDEAASMLSDVSPQYLPEKTSLSAGAPFSAEEIHLVKLFRKTANKKVREGVLKQLEGVYEIEQKQRK